MKTLRIKNIYFVARLTMLELIRCRMLKGLFGFALVMLLSGQAFGYFTFGEAIKIITDIGLASITLIGLLSAVFATSWGLPQEIENRTLFMTLSYPVSKGQVIWGKYLGALGVVFLNIFFFSGLFLLSLYCKTYFASEPFAIYVPMLIKSIVLIFIQSALCTGIVLLASVFFTPVFNFLIFIAVYLLGNLSAMIPSLAAQSTLMKYSLFRLYYLMIPNFYIFNVKDLLVTGKDVSWSYIGGCGIYGLCYCLLLVLLTGILFEKREV